MAKNRWMAAAFCASIVTLAAGCAGGSSTSLVNPGGAPVAPTGSSTSRLQTTTAPEQQVHNIESRDAVGKSAPVDPLANWEFLEPLAVTDTASFSVPSWVTKCASIDPIMGGLWYVALSTFSAPLGEISLPLCTLPAASSSDVAAKYHADSIIPAGSGNVYIVEIDVGFISLTTTPIAGPALGASEFEFASLESDLTFQRDHLYAFFLAEYTGTGQPATVSI